ncbi:unnamed protein product [Lathyrus sativus]|nr:unnamed protein product [Lathyrus sativus]
MVSLKDSKLPIHCWTELSEFRVDGRKDINRKNRKSTDPSVKPLVVPKEELSQATSAPQIEVQHETSQPSFDSRKSTRMTKCRALVGIDQAIATEQQFLETLLLL